MLKQKNYFPEIIGSSASMRNIFTQIIKVAPTDSTVLISGESGTGKELIASSIYEHSIRKGKPFIKINCVAIPEGLLESELFGHEKGSFTGAIEQKKGKFEIADKGTIFLDEIGDMPLATQAKLLRVLQEKEFERVGGTKPIRVDIRFIAATNKNLPEMIKNGTFQRRPLFSFKCFSHQHSCTQREKRGYCSISKLFSGIFARTSESFHFSIAENNWLFLAGKCRELKNVLEQASILSENGIIEATSFTGCNIQKMTNLI